VEERGRTVIASGSVGDLAVETAVSAGDDVFLLEVINKTLKTCCITKHSEHSERIPVHYYPVPGGAQTKVTLSGLVDDASTRRIIANQLQNVEEYKILDVIRMARHPEPAAP
jgi:hypothetical protein